MRTGTPGMHWVLSATVFATSCGMPAGDDPAEVATTTMGIAVEPQIRRESFVAERKLPTGRWRYWGKIEKAEPWETRGEDRDTEAENPSRELREPERMAIGDPESGDVYTVEFSEKELLVLTEALEKAGFANGAAGDSVAGEEDDFVQKMGWPLGSDTRTPQGIHEYALNATLRARNGQLDSTCSATLVGGPGVDGYFIVTAAHCLFAKESGNWLDPDFFPRRDQCLTNTGAAISGCDTTPYGNWGGGQYMTYQYWLENCRGQSQNDACRSRDIAVVRVFRPAGEAFPGAHGFGDYSDSTIQNTTSYNKGYPNCGGAGDPDDSGGSASSPNNVCRVSTLYGSSGTIGTTSQSGRLSTVSHAMSAGMSGSSYYIHSSGAKVFAVFSGGPLCFSGCTNEFPSKVARITSTFYGWMLDFMGI